MASLQERFWRCVLVTENPLLYYNGERGCRICARAKTKRYTDKQKGTHAQG